MPKLNLLPLKELAEQAEAQRMGLTKMQRDARFLALVALAAIEELVTVIDLTPIVEHWSGPGPRRTVDRLAGSAHDAIMQIGDRLSLRLREYAPPATDDEPRS